RRFIAAGIRGWICNTSSENAFAAPYPDVAGYVATKHASLGYSDAIRTQFGDKVGVSVLCPGPVNTSVWNAGRVRPDRYGGPTAGNPLNEKFLADAGLDPSLVGKMAVAGIRAEDFYILTHPENLESVRKRYEEIKACVVRQFPDYTPS
ncbi:MAG: SDR family NAD(P)-dependent oxidoreductase, partial [Janthinobacterium lividum]